MSFWNHLRHSLSLRWLRKVVQLATSKTRRAYIPWSLRWREFFCLDDPRCQCTEFIGPVADCSQWIQEVQYNHS
jgi:hypothetical protein